MEKVRMIAVVCAVVALGFFSGTGCSQEVGNDSVEKELLLAENGAANYVIVAPDKPSETDKFAMEELSRFLKQSTGADFKIESPEKASIDQKKIFVGLSGASMKVLGGDPLKGMENQDHVERTIGDNVFLYGKGPHGNLYAVYDFLENSVGCRWYSAFGGMKIPAHKVLRVQMFNRRGCPAFPYRMFYSDMYFLRPEAMLFLCRNGANQEVKLPGFVNEVKMIPPVVHTLFSYIPPSENEKKLSGVNPPLRFLKNKNYFTSNPEFFSMNKEGKRVDRQLCFSNKMLREELTKNVEGNIKLNGEKGLVTIHANDSDGSYCYCTECESLERKYACHGGPLLDYVIELCGFLKDKYPEVYVRIFAYRKNQSQKPPKIDRLPDNMVLIFTPIDANFAADWGHPSNAETWRDLQEWCRLTKNVWVWYYPNHYLRYVPFGNIEMLANNIRLMKQAGVKGIFFEHDVGLPEGLGFAELQSWLFLKLAQNQSQDVNMLIMEFMDFQYGKAATEMRRYLDDLEKCRKEMKFAITEGPSFGAFKYYLTPGNLLRWEQNFDKMEELTKEDSRTLFNVRQARVVLDYTALTNWQQAKKKHPEYFKNAKDFETRIHATYDRMIKEHVSPPMASYGNKVRKKFYEDLDTTMLFAENPGKPLPEMFKEICEEKIKRVVPRVYLQRSRTKDATAAFGLAGESVTENPFQFGFYDGYNKKVGVSKKLQLSDIKPGVYNLYKLGEVELTPDCLIWLAASSWGVSGKLESFYEPGTPNNWDVYVSMKFEGPSYQKDSKLEKDRVLCDQIVLIKPGI